MHTCTINNQGCVASGAEEVNINNAALRKETQHFGFPASSRLAGLPVIKSFYV